MRCNFKTTHIFKTKEHYHSSVILIVEECRLKHHGESCNLQRTIQYQVGGAAKRHNRTSKYHRAQRVEEHLPNQWELYSEEPYILGKA